MPTTHITQNEELWDAFVLRHGGGFLQSWGWSQFQEAAGREVYRVRIDEPARERAGEGHDDTIVQFVNVIQPLPLGMRYAYVPRGPVIRRGPGVDALANFDSFVGAWRETIGREGCIFGRVEFPFLQVGDIIGPQDLRRAGFRPVKSIQPADTLIVDLDRSEADLLAAMHPKTRYNIRVAERHGVEIREAAYGNAHLLQHDVEVFWSLLDHTAERDKFHTHARRYYEKMIDALSPQKRGGLQVKLVFADYRGEAVAAALVAYFGDTATYLHGASASASRQVMAPYLLHWRIMTAAQAEGFRHYDFWGVAPPDASLDHPWAGVTRFKTGFGGRRESYLGAWELPGNAFWYNLYRFAKRFRNL